MPEFDLFAFYRRLVLMTAGVYSVTRFCVGIWRWRLDTLSAGRPEALVRRWVEVSVLRLRASRFVWTAVQNLALAVLLVWIVWLQMRPTMP